MPDSAFRLLLDLWMTHDGPDDELGNRLNTEVLAECERRQLNVVEAYHEFKVDA